ncbi:hypothetical protein L873DRAFT_1791741 [Choiromyces venosus 120613-1]|uniref:Uncharacterized protein n=1 Tax=Choiromyces venosus 120613-1 TaxID=1336337 RepID=A0A3N4JIQ7_9PEZI|nr:hypothetical protein L873DRAFT_1791741 [Choiromyces venosus 120613-1]
MPSHLLMPMRHVPEFLHCQPSNITSYMLLVAVPNKLHATLEIVLTCEFLLNLKTDILTLRHLLIPVRYVSEFPYCQLSNNTSHILQASVHAELQAAMQIVFTGEFLLTLKTDISTPRHLLMSIRHHLESPQCQPSSNTPCNLLAMVPAALQATVQVVFIGEFLLTLKTDILMPRHSVLPIRCDPNSPRCLL